MKGRSSISFFLKSPVVHTYFENDQSASLIAHAMPYIDYIIKAKGSFNLWNIIRSAIRLTSFIFSRIHLIKFTNPRHPSRCREAPFLWFSVIMLQNCICCVKTPAEAKTSAYTCRCTELYLDRETGPDVKIISQSGRPSL